MEMGPIPGMDMGGMGMPAMVMGGVVSAHVLEMILRLSPYKLQFILFAVVDLVHLSR